MTAMRLVFCICSTFLSISTAMNFANPSRRYDGGSYVIEPQYTMPLDGAHGSPLGSYSEETERQSDARKSKDGTFEESIESSDEKEPAQRPAGEAGGEADDAREDGRREQPLGLDRVLRTSQDFLDKPSGFNPQALPIELKKTQGSQDKPRYNQQIHPIEVPLETARALAELSARLEGAKGIKIPDEHLAPTASLRTGDYWDGFYQHDAMQDSQAIVPEAARTRLDRPAATNQLEQVKLHISPGSKVQALVQHLRQVSTPLLYIINSDALNKDADVLSMS